jgi:hypothetical protein
MADITREAIVDAARRAAADAGGRLSRSDFARVSGISLYHVYRAFPEGGWSEVKRLAGLEFFPQETSLSDDELLQEFHRVALELGAIPTWAVFSARPRFSGDTVRKRFGGSDGTLARYRAWLECNDPASPLIEQLTARTTVTSRGPVTVPQSSAVPARMTWPKGDGPQFGTPIDFRGLRHAPINEQGVVFLFGMISYELGFIVEAVHAAFPDCEAKRCVDRRNGRWQRVRIEFEYASSNFHDHGHDPRSCDVIVCWEHDWRECPLEVVELRRG